MILMNQCHNITVQKQNIICHLLYVLTDLQVREVLVKPGERARSCSYLCCSAHLLPALLLCLLPA